MHSPTLLAVLRKATWVFGAVVACGALALAQPPAGAGTKSRSLPDSPQPKADVQDQNAGAQRFVGYMTKRSLFFPDIAVTPGPLDNWQKFKLFTNQAVSPEVFLTSAISAGFSQARGVPYADEGGMEGYGRRFAQSMARGASNNFFSTVALGMPLHQDPRFFPESNPSFGRALKYAAHRVFVTRKDSGAETINVSGLLGPAMGEALANVYLPTSEQTAGRTFTRYGSDLAWHFAGYVFKEYWPVFFRNMGLNRLKVVPTPAPPQPSN